MLFYYYEILLLLFNNFGFNCLSQQQQNVAMCKASTFKVKGISSRQPIYVRNFVDNIVVVSFAKLTYYCFWNAPNSIVYAMVLSQQITPPIISKAHLEECPNKRLSKRHWLK